MGFTCAETGFGFTFAVAHSGSHLIQLNSNLLKVYRQQPFSCIMFKTSDVDVQDLCSRSKVKLNLILIIALKTLHRSTLITCSQKVSLKRRKPDTSAMYHFFYWTYIEILKKKHEVAPLLKFYFLSCIALNVRKIKLLIHFQILSQQI